MLKLLIFHHFRSHNSCMCNTKWPIQELKLVSTFSNPLSCANISLPIAIRCCMHKQQQTNIISFANFSLLSAIRCCILIVYCSKVIFYRVLIFPRCKKDKRKSRECHSHKPQPFPDPKRKRKPTNLNKHKPNKRTKSTKISSLFPERGNRNTKRTEKHKNKMTHGKTYNKSPRRINHKATKSKTNTGTTALEQSVEQTIGALKHVYS